MGSPHESLEVWRLAHKLALLVYKATQSFPASTVAPSTFLDMRKTGCPRAQFSTKSRS